jgi:hypothetical protein
MTTQEENQWSQVEFSVNPGGRKISPVFMGNSIRQPVEIS